MQFVAIDTSDAISHYGVLGMKWGVRKERSKSGGTKSKPGKKMDEKTKKRLKTAAKIGAVAVGTALVVCGGYKLHSKMNTSFIHTGKRYFSGIDFDSKKFRSGPDSFKVGATGNPLKPPAWKKFVTNDPIYGKTGAIARHPENYQRFMNQTGKMATVKNTSRFGRASLYYHPKSYSLKSRVKTTW